MMKSKITDNLDHPEQLEKLYREDKKGFEQVFSEIYPEISGHQMARFWKARLEFDDIKEDKFKNGKRDVIFLILTCMVSGFLIKIPQLFGLDPVNSFFYEKNAGLIVLLGLSIYAFLIKDSLRTKQVLITLSVFIISALFINLLPMGRERHSVTLAYMHLPLMIWCLYGLIFTDFDIKDSARRMDYLKYNGDLAILVALILIAGGILTVVTLGLFSAIDLNIERFYFDYIVMLGLVSSPVVASYIIRNYPFVANKTAPIIANIFSPLVLITLIIYLISILITGKDPYNDRDFLIVFNLMLLGVMGIIVFSISETSVDQKQRFSEMILFALSVVTLIIDLVALSAILYRLGEYGFTPNRTAVLGSNLLIFGNLVLIMVDLYRVNFKNKEIKQVERTISNYLPLYALWTIFVVFVMPVIFGFK